MTVKETFVHMHDTKQTIYSTQTVEIKCPKFVSISNCYVKSVFWLPKLLFSNTIIMGTAEKLKCNRTARPLSTCFTDGHRDEAPLI